MTTTLSAPAPSPTAQPAGQLVSRRSLLPGLHPADWAEKPGLSDDGFCDSFATIALSRRLCAGLHCVTDNGSVTVSQRGLGELDLSTHRAWDLAAENLLHRAHGTAGLTFFTRPVTGLIDEPVPAVQVGTPGAPPTSWLAHPHTFTVLHRHLCGLLGAEVVYLAPTSQVLIAAPENAPELDLLRNRLNRPGGGRPLGAPVVAETVSYSRGFPAVSG